MPLTRFQLFFVFALGLCSQTYGQGKGVIYGVVSDGGLNEGLAFVNIGIADQGIGTTSDIDGRYRLVNVPAGTHQIDFSYLGYATESAQVTVGAGEEVELDMTLYQEGMKTEEVVVKAQATGPKAARTRRTAMPAKASASPCAASPPASTLLPSTASACLPPRNRNARST